MLAFVRKARPDARVICICSAQSGASERIAQTLRVDAMPLGIPRPATALLGMLDRLLLTLPRRAASLLRAIVRARKLDALIVPGTGILDDFGESPFGSQSPGERRPCKDGKAGRRRALPAGIVLEEKAAQDSVPYLEWRDQGWLRTTPGKIVNRRAIALQLAEIAGTYDIKGNGVHSMPLDLITERWLPAVGYEGLYEVSDQGRVRSLARIDCRGSPCAVGS